MSLQVYAVRALQDNYIWIVANDKNHEAIVIDPSEAEPVQVFLKKHHYRLRAILNTHHHMDHIGGNESLKENWGCRLYAPEKNLAQIPGISKPVKEGDSLDFDWVRFQVMEIPGHTLGHVGYHVADQNWYFCGDTLFSLGCGRLFEGTPEMMWQSLKKIRALPDETSLFCGHEYTMKNLEFTLSLDPSNAKLETFKEKCLQRLGSEGRTLPTTLAQEKELNPFLRADQISMKRLLDMEDVSDEMIFATIRKLKDQF